MLISKIRKPIIIVTSVVTFLCMGLFAYDRLPLVQMKASQALTWIRGVISPTGVLPTADAITAQPVEQKGFWLPDLMKSQPDSNGAGEVVQARQTNTRLPASVILPSPAFNPHKDYQDWNNCGPATLALGLRFWGWQGDQYTISDVVRPKRQDKNVNIEELAGYVNQKTDTLQAEVRVGGDLPLLENLIAGGFPVVIEESFKLEKSAWPGDDQWAGHYLLLTGYDQQNQGFTTQDSYYGPERLQSYSSISESWQAFNHVYLVIFPKEDIQQVQTLLGEDWPMVDNLQRNKITLENQLQSKTGNAYAWFNLGSTLTQQQDFASAVLAFNQARALGLPQRMLRYQFGPLIAAYQTGDARDLTRLADYALNITPDSEEALLWKGWSYELAEDHLSALSLFHKALEAHPGDQEAEKAIEIVRP